MVSYIPLTTYRETGCFRKRFIATQTLKMSKDKGTTVKEAFANFEQKKGKKPEESDHVDLSAQFPPLEKMDASLSTLKQCTQLSLSTNQIEKIANLNGLSNLRILSLARNNIKTLTGLEPVAGTLTQLWISYNNIEKLKGIGVLKKLNTLFMAHNKVSDINELSKLEELPCLEIMTFKGNPLISILDDQYESTMSAKLKRLKQLDGVPMIRNEEEVQTEQK